jgi:HemY protein
MADDPAEERWLQEAARQPDELRLARLMTELELHVDARRFGAALETLEAIGAGGKRHVAAQRLALKVYRAVGRWEELLRVVRQLEKHRALSAEQAASLKQLAHVERIRAFSGDTGAIAAYWARLPGDERVLPRIGPAVVRGLLDGGEHEIAQRIIEYRLDDAWDEPLVSMYAECEGGEALGRVTKAENWLRSHPDDPILLRTLGRLCMQLQLWGKAQSYLEASLAVRASRSVHLELARLLDSLDRRGDADRHYRAAAEQRA